ncbi:MULTISPECIES: thymidine phosphorylase family protein [unclassified Duganella]|uniref:thymidine phosphorylase family protein n=1 Tax=unclassified Duganella TaxID=2636909 RepID=UPI0006FA0FEB|nr:MULTISPECIES: thymidine phosphorylase family protein [unclassified Duganella]KQV61844.1 thymidine phosphorylase [Duganella sp. Root336D2]KRB84351.1 thymidine phosphorylase [Duganella sp. Root198D2]
MGYALRARRLGIDTYQQPVAYMRRDCKVCLAEGFEAQSRIELQCGGRTVAATLNVVDGGLLDEQDIGLSEAAWEALGAAPGAPVSVSHPAPLASFAAVRGKIHGRPLDDTAAQAIIADIAAGRYPDIHLASFITACSGNRLDLAETIALTRAMAAAGQRMHWPSQVVVDKHCVGGLPGNRTTLLVVPIVAACGMTMPKTSSRAITSPAGTADTMETLAPVAIGIDAMRRVVQQEGGCIVWGGSVTLSPADDVLIRVERPLELDSDGLLVASVLSKKLAAGASHVLIDIPVGRTAKVRSEQAAQQLAARLEGAGQALGLAVQCVLSDGSQPVGVGIGPALEAMDVLAVLQGAPTAPQDLRQRALALAAGVLELGGRAAPGQGMLLAAQTLDSGAAWARFQAICAAQGGMRQPPVAACTHALEARHAGRVIAIDNRKLATLAKLAGAPRAAAAGVRFFAPLGSRLEVGQPVLSIHADTPGELAYALEYAEAQSNLVTVEDA